ncbi:calcium-binding protein [Actinomadura sp. NTSP31]|uniref:calcium-binding protein n=1 Tax=Actinomadura sp. NTSP31 TaxID=1735447 RepID=UPI0035C11684
MNDHRRLGAAFLASGVVLGTALIGGTPARAATTVTFSGGVLNIVGDTAANSITVGRTTAGAITLNGLQVLGGAPTTGNVQRVRVDGGDGNDTLRIDETNGPMPQGEFLGGDGNDALTGGSGADTLTGGPGVDALSGNGGDDTITGGTGNDKAVGGPGIDTVALGEDDDEFTWNPGDGNDHVSPDTGKDTLLFNTGPEQVVNIAPRGPRAFVLIPPDPFSPPDTPSKVDMEISGFELVKLNVPDLQAPNTTVITREVSVNDAPGAGIGVVKVNFAPHAGPTERFNRLLFRGTVGADRIRLAGSPTSGVEVFGTSQTVLANQVDDLTVFGGDGDDVLDANGLPAGTARLTEFGGGNPFVDGHITDGNDTLIGTPGDDHLFGGTGLNRYEGRGGNDTIIDQ